MSQPRNRSRRTSAALFASVLAAGAMTVGRCATASAAAATAPDASQPTAVETLGAHDAKLLDEAEAKHAPTVTLIIAAKKGSAKEVADGLKEPRRHGQPALRPGRLPAGQGSHREGPQGRARCPASPRSTSTRPSSSRTRPRRPRPGRREVAEQGETVAGPGADTRRGQPVHADQRDRRGGLQGRAPRVGRPRRHDRHHGLRCGPGPPGAAEDHHRRAQDRRLGHRDRPARGRHLAAR